MTCGSPSQPRNDNMDDIEYKAPKMGAIIIHLKGRPNIFDGPSIESLLVQLVKSNNNHAMEINKLKGMEVDPKDYEVYVE